MKRDNHEAIQQGATPSPEIKFPTTLPELAKRAETVDEAVATKAVESAPTGLPAPVSPAPPPTKTQVNSGISTTTSVPAIADDNDLIEKEWVAKAKQIVNKTKNDPHLQNIEMNQYKATYIKKRFNKDVKLTET